MSLDTDELERSPQEAGQKTDVIEEDASPERVGIPTASATESGLDRGEDTARGDERETGDEREMGDMALHPGGTGDQVKRNDVNKDQVDEDQGKRDQLNRGGRVKTIQSSRIDQLQQLLHSANSR